MIVFMLLARPSSRIFLCPPVFRAVNLSRLECDVMVADFFFLEFAKRLIQSDTCLIVMTVDSRKLFSKHAACLFFLLRRRYFAENAAFSQIWHHFGAIGTVKFFRYIWDAFDGIHNNSLRVLKNIKQWYKIFSTYNRSTQFRERFLRIEIQFSQIENLLQ